jgi:hypothetical protein
VVMWTIRTIGFIATLAVTLYGTQMARTALATTVPDYDR